MHSIKTWPRYYDEVEKGNKPFELRKNDRDYKTGDALLLREYVPPILRDDGVAIVKRGYYTGRRMLKKITYVLHGGKFGLKKGYVILGFKNMKEDDDKIIDKP